MRLGQAWSSIRGIIRGAFSFADIKDLMGGAGLPVHELEHLQQKSTGGASKGQLMDGIDGLLGAQTADDSDRIIAACIAETLRLRPDLEQKFDESLRRVGWSIAAGTPHPLSLQIDVALAALPDTAAEGLRTALTRYRDGDNDGAISAVCGVVDSLTAQIFTANGLGNPFQASYQERVSRAFDSLEPRYREALVSGSVAADEVARLLKNQQGAVNQAAYVLAAYRRNFADAHGTQNAPTLLVQRALDCAVFVVRSLVSGLR